jgi:hypothetical protein
MISLATSIAWRLALQGVFLSFVSQEFDATGDVYGFLEHLACLEPKQDSSVLDTLAGSTDYSLVLTAQKRGTIPAAMWASAYFVFLE